MLLKLNLDKRPNLKPQISHPKYYEYEYNDDDDLSDDERVFGRMEWSREGVKRMAKNPTVILALIALILTLIFLILFFVLILMDSPVYTPPPTRAIATTAATMAVPQDKPTVPTIPLQPPTVAEQDVKVDAVVEETKTSIHVCDSMCSKEKFKSFWADLPLCFRILFVAIPVTLVCAFVSVVTYVIIMSSQSSLMMYDSGAGLRQTAPPLHMSGRSWANQT